MSKLTWWKVVCAMCVLGAAAAITSPAQTFTTLHSFTGYPTDGSSPDAALILATDGNFYGTTYQGGAHDWGAVFKITPGGTVTTLQSFLGYPKDGSLPRAPLIQASDGDFYGTTSYGGYGGDHDYGTVFKVTPSGTLTTVHSFAGDPTDGANPFAGLVQATNGIFYGTTQDGGANGAGTIFKVTPSGTLSTLYNFCSQSGCTDGDDLWGGLVQAADGNLYGTTELGGANGGGTVFSITPSGALTTLYNFCSGGGCTGGEEPLTGLVLATDGNFYGTTVAGVSNGGTVFKITPSGTLTTLYSFCSQPGCPDGEYPYAGLVQATDGNFYGTTAGGGANSNDLCEILVNSTGCGTAFKITASGTLTTLYSFCSQSNCADGATPIGGLVQGTDGNLYGTTVGGGDYASDGTVFSLAVGLGPFVEARPTYGKVGAAIKILGTDLTGASSVSFNGTAATFTVVSPSLINTTVPSGATTGKIQVVTPGGTLTSNSNFRVTQ